MGLARPEETDGKRAFRLTDTGRVYVEAHHDEVAAPCEAMVGNARQAADARTVPNNTRRDRAPVRIVAARRYSRRAAIRAAIPASRQSRPNAKFASASIATSSSLTKRSNSG